MRSKYTEKTTKPESIKLGTILVFHETVFSFDLHYRLQCVLSILYLLYPVMCVFILNIFINV